MKMPNQPSNNLTKEGLYKIKELSDPIKDMNANRNIWQNKDMAKSAEIASKIKRN